MGGIERTLMVIPGPASPRCRPGRQSRDPIQPSAGPCRGVSRVGPGSDGRGDAERRRLPPVALPLASEAYLMETGRIVMSGPAGRIGADEGVRRAYLGY